jgi:hypothetical protein
MAVKGISMEFNEIQLDFNRIHESQWDFNGINRKVSGTINGIVIHLLQYTLRKQIWLTGKSPN